MKKKNMNPEIERQRLIAKSNAIIKESFKDGADYGSSLISIIYCEVNDKYTPVHISNLPTVWAEVMNIYNELKNNGKLLIEQIDILKSKGYKLDANQLVAICPDLGKYV